MSYELENSGIRVAVGDCSVTEHRRWRPPYQIGKTVHMHAKHYKHNEDGRMARDVCGNGSVLLSHSGKVVRRIGIHTHIHDTSYLTTHKLIPLLTPLLPHQRYTDYTFETNCLITCMDGWMACDFTSFSAV